MSALTNPAAESMSLAGEDTMHVSAHRGGSYRGESAAARAVARWHDETHPGAFSQCSEQPCDTVRRVDNVSGSEQA